MTIALAPVWIIPAWVAASVIAAVLIGKCIAHGQREPSARVTEGEVRRDLYSLRSFEKRTEHVVPRERSKW